MLAITKPFGLLAVLDGPVEDAVSFISQSIRGSELYSLGYSLGHNEALSEVERVSGFTFEGDFFDENVREAAWAPRDGRTVPVINGSILSDSFGVMMGTCSQISMPRFGEMPMFFQCIPSASLCGPSLLLVGFPPGHYNFLHARHGAGNPLFTTIEDVLVGLSFALVQKGLARVSFFRRLNHLYFWMRLIREGVLDPFKLVSYRGAIDSVDLPGHPDVDLRVEDGKTFYELIDRSVLDYREFPKHVAKHFSELGFIDPKVFDH
jgi:hypothetical protein